MSERATWFRCDPSRLLGALSGMEPDSGYLYTVILMRIYEVGGPILDDEVILSRRTGLSRKRVETALSWLVGHGKIERNNGSIDSETTHEELAFREKSIIDARNAGKESAKRKQKFHNGKIQQKQQNVATTVEQPLNGSATAAQRQSTESEKEIEAELSKDSSGTNPDGLVVGADAPTRFDRKKNEDKEKLRSLGETWNAFAGELGLSQIEEIRPGSPREKSALARIREGCDFDRVFTKIRGSPFLRGERGSTPASFDWIINPTNYLKIIEGKYDEIRQAKPPAFAGARQYGH